MFGCEEYGELHPVSLVENCSGSEWIECSPRGGRRVRGTDGMLLPDSWRLGTDELLSCQVLGTRHY